MTKTKKKTFRNKAVVSQPTALVSYTVMPVSVTVCEYLHRIIVNNVYETCCVTANNTVSEKRWNIPFYINTETGRAYVLTSDTASEDSMHISEPIEITYGVDDESLSKWLIGKRDILKHIFHLLAKKRSFSKDIQKEWKKKLRNNKTSVKELFNELLLQNRFPTELHPEKPVLDDCYSAGGFSRIKKNCLPQNLDVEEIRYLFDETALFEVYLENGDAIFK